MERARTLVLKSTRSHTHVAHAKTVTVTAVITYRFYRAMLCIRGTSHGPVSVCVCLSVTSRSSTKTAKRRITQTTPHDMPRDSSFLMPKIFAKFDRGHPLRGRRMQVGWVKIGDFRQISDYISKTVKDRHILKSNRKSYALYQMVTLPLTLSAP